MDFIFPIFSTHTTIFFAVCFCCCHWIFAIRLVIDVYRIASTLWLRCFNMFHFCFHLLCIACGDGIHHCTYDNFYAHKYPFYCDFFCFFFAVFPQGRRLHLSDVTQEKFSIIHERKKSFEISKWRKNMFS